MNQRVWRLVEKCTACGIYHPVGQNCKCADKIVMMPIIEEQEFLREE